MASLDPGFTALGSSARNQWQVNQELCNLVRPQRPIDPLSINALPQNITVNVGNSALIVVDMQNDFCHNSGWLASIGVDVKPARKPIEPLTKLLPVLRQSSVPVIWLNWGNRPDKLNLSPSLLHVYNGDGQSVGLGNSLASAPSSKGLSNHVLEKNSWGAAVVDELAPIEGDIRIDKFRMSGFFDTCLDSVLRNLDIKTLFFAGVNADQCVLATLMDANFLGYDCVLLEDCCATTSPDFCWQATLYNVRQCFGFTCFSNAFAN